MNSQKNKRTLFLFFCSCVLALFTLIVSELRPVYAAVLSVNGAIGSDVGNCQSSPCKTIGYAINQAGNGDTLFIASGIYAEHLNILKSIAIIGTGACSTILDGNAITPNDRIIIVGMDRNVTISGMTIQNVYGNYDWTHNGIYNLGHLTLSNSLVISITSGWTQAGAIYNDYSGVLTITNSTISNNQSGAYGGGVANYGVMTLDHVTISGNRAYHGGGILNGGAMTITNSTINGNTAWVAGGGIQNAGTASITNSTIISNTGNSHSGGFYNLGIAYLSGVILTRNNGHSYGGGIHNGSMLSLSASTIATNTAQYGAGVSNYGTLTMTFGTVRDNIAHQGFAGFLNTGTLNLSQVSISGNIAETFDGGGITNAKDSQQKGFLNLTDVTISHNVAQRNGGGIFNKDGMLIATNVTVSGNSASIIAGIDNSGQITLTNTTITDNQVTQPSGLASIYNGYNSTSVVYLKNTIIANSGSVPNCRSDLGIGIISLGYNLNSDNSCNLTTIGDLTNTNPFLGSLANNGGATLTHALNAGSPAINAGDNTGCPATDQRGMPRPLGARCDIGAYEFSGTYPFAFILPVIRK